MTVQNDELSSHRTRTNRRPDPAPTRAAVAVVDAPEAPQAPEAGPGTRPRPLVGSRTAPSAASGDVGRRHTGGSVSVRRTGTGPPVRRPYARFRRRDATTGVAVVWTFDPE